MSDAREPTPPHPDDQNRASGRRSEHNQPPSDAHEPTPPDPGPPDDPDAHVDLETLADLAEGLLGSRAGSVRAHVASCPRCEQRVVDLAEVRRALAAAPAATMPDDVVARVDAAIAAAEPSGPAARSRVRRPWYQRQPLRVGLAAAAIVVVAAGGVATTRAFLAGDRPVATTGSSEASDAREGGPGAGGAAPGAAPLSTSAGAAPFVFATNTEYSAETVDEQVAGLVRRRVAQGSPDGARPEPSGAPDAVAPLADPDRLRGCVAAATGGSNRRPIVVDLARYEGKPAAVVVLPGRGGTQLDVWVVGRDCSMDDADVLLRTRVS